MRSVDLTRFFDEADLRTCKLAELAISIKKKAGSQGLMLKGHKHLLFKKEFIASLHQPFKKHLIRLDPFKKQCISKSHSLPRFRFKEDDQ